MDVADGPRNADPLTNNNQVQWNSGMTWDWFEFHGFFNRIAFYTAGINLLGA